MSPEVRALSARETADRFRELVGDIPDAEAIEVNYTITNQGADLTYVLQHRDPQQLSAASNDLQNHLRSFDGTFYVRDSQRGESDEILFNLKPGAEKLGITLADVSRQVRQAYYGEEVQRLPRENGDVRVMVKYPMDLRRDLSSLGNFRVRTADGREVPLLSVVDVELSRGVQSIQRRDGERIVSVSADLNHDLISDITKDVKENFLPELEGRYPDLKILKGGQQEEEQEF